MRTGRRALLRLFQRAFDTTSSTPRLILGFAAAVALGMLVACTPGEIDPPNLDLLTMSETRDPLARDPDAPVIIKNGRGELLA